MDMTSISQVDQAIFILRERLRQVRKGRTGKVTVPAKVGKKSTQPLAQIMRLAAVETLPPREIRCALVRTLLAEAFGDEVANDLSFQAVADRVTAMLDETQETKDMLDRAVAELRASG
ncbi:MAG: hypothetical protein AABZ45_02440 [Pseudomonadota bacterium]